MNRGAYWMIVNKLAALKQIMYFDNRWQLFLDRLIFKKTSLSAYRLGDMEFMVDHSAGDANGIRDIIVSSMYKRLISNIKFGDSIKVIDCGANGGASPLCCKAWVFQ